MSEQRFIIIVERNDLYPAVSADTMRESLSGGIVSLFDYPTVIKEVRKYDPDSEAVTGKIVAIKRIRTLLPGTLLRDAKFLTDHAENTGSAEWSTVKVICTDDGFRVIDNS